jgi:hypothetical protein
MIARCLALVYLLYLPVQAQDKPWWEETEKFKEERALVEKQLFPLLQEADEVVLYSLFPLPKEMLTGAKTVANNIIAFEGGDQNAELSETEKQVADLVMKGDHFHGYPILGKVEITVPAERVKMLGDLRAAIRTKEESRSHGMCFTPRHGVLVRKGEQRLSFVICFECKRVLAEGLPEAAKEAEEVLKRFDESLKAILNSRFDATGVTRSPYKDHPPRLPEALP